MTSFYAVAKKINKFARPDHQILQDFNIKNCIFTAKYLKIQGKETNLTYKTINETKTILNFILDLNPVLYISPVSDLSRQISVSE